MKNINWTRKLTSRKMWTAVTALIMAGASVVAYIIGEGLTDAANVETEVEVTTEEEV